MDGDLTLLSSLFGSSNTNSSSPLLSLRRQVSDERIRPALNSSTTLGLSSALGSVPPRVPSPKVPSPADAAGVAAALAPVPVDLTKPQLNRLSKGTETSKTQIKQDHTAALSTTTTSSNGKGKRKSGHCPTEQDVLLGRGRPFQQHPGNVRLHRLVDQYRPLYLQARKRDKTGIARTVIQRVHQRGGRFLRRMATLATAVDEDDAVNGGSWEEVPLHVAIEKTSHALRGRPRHGRKINKEAVADSTAGRTGGANDVIKVMEAPPAAVHLALQQQQQQQQQQRSFDTGAYSLLAALRGGTNHGALGSSALMTRSTGPSLPRSTGPSLPLIGQPSPQRSLTSPSARSSPNLSRSAMLEQEQRQLEAVLLADLQQRRQELQDRRFRALRELQDLEQLQTMHQLQQQLQRRR